MTSKSPSVRGGHAIVTPSLGEAGVSVSPAPVAAFKDQIQASPGASLNLLVMTDSTAGEESLRQEFHRQGFTPAWQNVVTEADYRAGLEAPPEVLFVHFTRGRLSVQRALEILAERGLDVPLIVVADGLDEAAIVAGLRMGVADFVTGNRLDRLAAVVRGALAERRQRRAQRQALDALQRNQERLARIVASGTSVTYALKGCGHSATPIWMSENVTTLTGFPVAEALRPEWWWEQLHPEDRPRVSAELAGLPDRERLLLEYRLLTKAGEYRWLRDERTLLRDAAGDVLEIVGSWLDVTDRKQLETQLRQAQKMEAVGQLASGVAHDFNNLLTAIRCQTETVLAHETISAAARDMLRQVVTATERATDLTRQLLAFSRSQPIQQVPLDLNQLVGNLNKMLHRTISENIKLSLERTPDLPPIHADPSMVEQVLLNLAVNARDAMPRGGALTIATTVLTTDLDHLRRHPGARLGEFVRLSVTDTGCGIPAEVLPNIFDPFFTTKEVGKGTGLGLATVFGIVQQHQGWIEVDSQPGRGTSFRIYFPARRELRLGEAAVPGTTEIPSGTETLLVVEDDPDLREFLGLSLQRLGYQVLAAATATEAVCVWEAHAATIGLVLTDAVLAEGMNGWELATRLRSHKPELRVIVMSGYSAEMRTQGAPAETGIQFLPKPFDPGSLAKLIRQCLDPQPPPESES